MFGRLSSLGIRCGVNSLLDIKSPPLSLISHLILQDIWSSSSGLNFIRVRHLTSGIHSHLEDLSSHRISSFSSSTTSGSSTTHSSSFSSSTTNSSFPHVILWPSHVQYSEFSTISKCEYPANEDEFWLFIPVTSIDIPGEGMEADVCTGGLLVRVVWYKAGPFYEVVMAFFCRESLVTKSSLTGELRSSLTTMNECFYLMKDNKIDISKASIWLPNDNSGVHTMFSSFGKQKQRPIIYWGAK